MTHRLCPRAASALLPIATAALAIGICIADILTGVAVALAVLYVAVVLMSARFCRPPGIVLYATGCVSLTVLSYFLSGESAINSAIAVAAIGLTTFLALKSQSAEATLREQASLLDLTHDSIVARRFDDDVITYWSRGAEELYGWPRAEAVGRVGSALRKIAIPLPLDEIKAELLRVGRWEGELVNNKRDGTPVLVTSRWTLQRDKHGRPAVILVTSNDVTEQKRASEALRESEEQWREVFEHNPVMYFMVSPTGTVLSVNGFGAAQLGYTAAELIGKSVLTVFFEEDRELVKDQLASCVEELGCSRSWEIRKVRKDGTVLWVRENAKAVQRAGNDAIVLIACEDITERRRGEQRVAAAYAVTRVLAESDSLAAAAPHILRAIGENLEWDWGALWSFVREGAPLRCDCLWHAPDIETAEFDTVSRERKFPAGEGQLNQVWRSASPSWIVDATTEPQFLRASAASRALLRGGVIFPILLDTEALGVVEFFSRAARERDAEQLATLSAIGSQIGQFIKRRRAEAALRASEERWRRLFETSAAGMALTRLDGVFTAANPALQRMLGRAEEEIVGHNVLELNPEDERAATADALARYRGGSLDERHVEKKYLKKDGSPVWLNITTTLVPATETAAAFLQAVYVDVSERVRFEAALRASEERWRAMFETAAVGIVTFSSEHRRYVTANKSFQLMTGYTEDELKSLTPLDITHEDDRAASRKHIDKIVAGSQRSYRIEKRYRRKDGEIVWADVNTFIVPATDSAPAFPAVMAVDITARRHAEDALRLAQSELARVSRLTTMGGFAASIAHEVNQPLMAIVTNAETCLRWLETDPADLDEARQAAERIVGNGHRAAAILRSIRGLARKSEPEMTQFDINDGISDVLVLIRGELHRHNVVLETELLPDLPTIMGDRVQLQQVILNLISNGIEAMSAVTLRPRMLRVSSQSDQQRDVTIAVADTGTGLDPTKMESIFDAFFTTKPEGMGMGLSICRSIVEAHGGRLWALPNVPYGSVFRFTVPVMVERN
ncbi:MAG: PAS domain S-box protein [Alphaproteobacteria bacterium]|nr:PAS domain S-box protein [Alphaproteobacteria bacterium]